MGYRTDYVVLISSYAFTLTSYTNYNSRTKGKTWDGIIEFWSTTNNAWTTWTGTSTIESSSQETDWGTAYAIKLRGTGNTKLNLTTNSARWYIDKSSSSWFTPSVYCRGNIEVLFDYQAVNNNQHPTIGSYACYNLFATNQYIKSTFDSSSVVTLPDYGFRGMYQSCGLTEASDLSATTIGAHCYEYMFYNCTSLTTAPSISATTISDYCCYHMFERCTKLTTPPSELPATTLATYCYASMFINCTSLSTAPELPATTLAERCYSQMFSDCVSLKNSPELPATTLATECYYMMFYGCTSLITVSELPATTLVSGCYYSMFQGCTSLITTPELPATTLADGCYEGMFSNCTSLVIPPELPATTLATSCYRFMFSESGIQISSTQTELLRTEFRIPTTGTGTTASNALTDMFYGNTVSTPSINTTYYVKGKLMDYKVTNSELTSIANAIRSKSGNNNLIEYPFDYLEEIGKLGSQIYYIGSLIPPDNLGEDGDLYVKI